MESFKLIHKKGKLYVVVMVNGIEYEKDVTDYFAEANPHDDWLDFRLDLKYPRS